MKFYADLEYFYQSCCVINRLVLGELGTGCRRGLFWGGGLLGAIG